VKPWRGPTPIPGLREVAREPGACPPCRPAGLCEGPSPYSESPRGSSCPPARSDSAPEPGFPGVLRGREGPETTAARLRRETGCEGDQEVEGAG